MPLCSRFWSSHQGWGPLGSKRGVSISVYAHSLGVGVWGTCAQNRLATTSLATEVWTSRRWGGMGRKGAVFSLDWWRASPPVLGSLDLCFSLLLELVLLQPPSQVIPGAGRSILPCAEPKPFSFSRPPCSRPALLSTQNKLTVPSSTPTCGWAGTHDPALSPEPFLPSLGECHRNTDKGTGGTLWDSLERKSCFHWASKVKVEFALWMIGRREERHPGRGNGSGGGRDWFQGSEQAIGVRWGTLGDRFSPAETEAVKASWKDLKVCPPQARIPLSPHVAGH